MIHYLTLTDEDQDRVYDLRVDFRCVEEIGGAPGLCTDLNRVELLACRVKFGKVEGKVFIEPGRIREVARWVEAKFEREIVAECENHFFEAKGAA